MKKRTEDTGTKAPIVSMSHSIPYFPWTSDQEICKLILNGHCEDKYYEALGTAK